MFYEILSFLNSLKSFSTAVEQIDRISYNCRQCIPGSMQSTPGSRSHSTEVHTGVGSRTGEGSISSNLKGFDPLCSPDQEIAQLESELINKVWIGFFIKGCYLCRFSTFTTSNSFC